jgi:hypothetical protein
MLKFRTSAQAFVHSGTMPPSLALQQYLPDL